MTLPAGEWEQRGDGSYVFGVKVRGVVRERLADVWQSFGSPLGTERWRWSAAGVFGGRADYLELALAGAEKMLEQQSRGPT